MVAAPWVWLRTSVSVTIILGCVRPHSIWNQISIGLPAAASGNDAFTRLPKFF